MSSLFDIIRVPFGFLIQWFNSITSSYLLAIILFSIVLKIVLFPFGIKQQKNSQKQAQLRPKENVIRKKYAGRTDRATQLKMNTEIQELYQKENFSPLAGCLPMLVQMLVLLAVYAVVRMPLTYTASLPEVDSVDTVAVVQQTASELIYKNDEKLPEKERQIQTVLKLNQKQDDKAFEKALKSGSYNYNSEIVVIDYIENHGKEFSEAFDAKTEYYDKDGDKVELPADFKKEVTAENVIKNLPNLEVFRGFNLGTTPSFQLIKEKELGKKLLILVPVLTLITSYFGQALTRKFTYQPEQTPEMKSQMRMMNIFMPLFSFYIAFQVPAAVGIYWMMSNTLSPVQQIALSKMFPIPEITPEEMREAERLYGGKQKKKKGNTATSSTAKKKSLVYDDDDEYESVSTVPNQKAPEKKALKEKKTVSEKTAVEKAPLKEEETK